MSNFSKSDYRSPYLGISSELGNTKLEKLLTATLEHHSELLSLIEGCPSCLSKLRKNHPKGGLLSANQQSRVDSNVTEEQEII